MKNIILSIALLLIFIADISAEGFIKSPESILIDKKEFVNQIHPFNQYLTIKAGFSWVSGLVGLEYNIEHINVAVGYFPLDLFDGMLGLDMGGSVVSASIYYNFAIKAFHPDNPYRNLYYLGYAAIVGDEPVHIPMVGYRWLIGEGNFEMRIGGGLMMNN